MVHDEAVEFLKSIKSPVGVISKLIYIIMAKSYNHYIAVWGKYRTGKSYLLNKIILNHQGSGFKVGPTVNACTKGLVVWNKPIEITHKNETLKVIVIDSEGMGSTDIK